MGKEKSLVLRLTTRHYPDPDAGGPAKYVYYLSKHTYNENIKIINLSTKSKEDNKEKNVIDKNFIIYRINLKGLDIKNTSVIKEILFFLKFSIFSIVKILKIHRKERIDILHADSPSVTGIPLIFFKKIFKIPYVYTYHGLDNKNILELYIYKIINRYASQIVVITNKIRLFFKNVYNTDVSKFKVMPNGISCPIEPKHVKNKEQFEKIKEEINMNKINLDLKYEDKIILYVGRMIFEQKVLGMVDFMHAFDRFLTFKFKNKDKFNEINGEIYLFFIGDGTFIEMLKKEHKSLQNKKKILILGYRKDVQKLFSISELSALTSYIEGFPTVILESMIAGVPAIGSDVGDVKKIIQNTGYVVKPGDREQMYGSLIDYFSNISKAKLLKENSFKKVKDEFDWKKIGKETNDIYYKIINRR